MLSFTKCKRRLKCHKSIWPLTDHNDEKIILKLNNSSMQTENKDENISIVPVKKGFNLDSEDHHQYS